MFKNGILVYPLRWQLLPSGKQLLVYPANYYVAV
jgi:hypothetical protein